MSNQPQNAAIALLNLLDDAVCNEVAKYRAGVAPIDLATLIAETRSGAVTAQIREIVAAYDQRVAADVVATTDATWVHATKLAALAKDAAAAGLTDDVILALIAAVPPPVITPGMSQLMTSVLIGAAARLGIDVTTDDGRGLHMSSSTTPLTPTTEGSTVTPVTNSSH